MRGFVQWTGTALVAATVIAACGGGSSNSNNPVTSIVKDPVQSGENQTATVATEVTDSLRVKVTEDGNVLAGATVTWATSGVGADVSPSTSVTDAAGLAATEWTISQTAGAQTATASLSGASGSPVTFHATGTAGAAATVTKGSGDNQTAIIGGAFATQLRVTVSDGFGNVVAGQAVTFAGVGGVVPSATTVNTAANGDAVITATGAGASGAGGVTATVGALTPVTFTLTTANAVREVTIGAGILFTSNRNATTNPAVDTIATGEGVLWRWAGGSHSVASTGAPSFTSSAVSATPGNIYTTTFGVAGTYQYECGVHGPLMTGRIVVQ